MRSAAASLILALLLAACGQTGDLYLPQKTPPPSAPAQPQPDEQNKKKEQAPQAPPDQAPQAPN